VGEVRVEVGEAPTREPLEVPELTAPRVTD
jgi:hypothetical protein